MTHGLCSRSTCGQPTLDGARSVMEKNTSGFRRRAMAGSRKKSSARRHSARGPFLTCGTRTLRVSWGISNRHSPGGSRTVISSPLATAERAGTSPVKTPRPPAEAVFTALITMRIGDQLLKKRFPLGAVIAVGRRQSPRAPALGGAPPRSAGCAGRRARRTTVELPSNGIRARGIGRRRRGRPSR